MTTESDLILVVDDEQSVCYVLSGLFAQMGCRTKAVLSAEEALSSLNVEKPAVALLDIRLPGMDGIELLAELKKVSPDTEVIMMTSHASTDTAIEAIRKKAYDYLTKPFENLDEVWITVRRALEKRKLSCNNRRLLLELKNSNKGLSAAVKRQKSLIDAGRAMGGIGVLNELLDFFVGVVAEELEVDRVSLMLVDENAQEMWIVASRGLEEKVKKEVRRKVGDGIAGWVAREGKPVLVKDVESDPRVKIFLQSTHATSFISAPIVLSIPILLREKVLGVINVTNRRSGQSFDEEDMAFLYSLAGQAAVAIERTQQYDELELAYESLKAAQTSLVDGERMHALGQMAAGVAHDFNNLLSGILGRTQLLQLTLKKKGAGPSELDSQLELIEKLALQGAATVRRIQEFSRIRKDSPSDSVDLNSVVDDAVDMTRAKWEDECETIGVRVDVRLERGQIPLIHGNAADLVQVVSNLIFNAVEAMPEGGELTLKTFLAENAVGLEVSDMGMGMSKEVKEKLFQPFFTTKGNGYGLGTSIVYGIVARHGGEIKVSSEEGRGTTFLLSLPIPDVSPKVAPSEKIPSTRKEGPARVLVVEDNELNRDMFGRYLAEMGHIAVLAADGKEMLPILEKESFDLVITDLNMPGISGWEVTKKVKKKNPRVPVILVSGWAIQQEDAHLRECGVDCVLQKPCRMSEFQEAVDKALSSTDGEEAEGTAAEEAHETAGA
ncbi:MAG: response regulator [Thermodesulfobacteriota bacterium]|nr:response regulator [Thermodesulfobacteriota bacterium]